MKSGSVVMKTERKAEAKRCVRTIRSSSLRTSAIFCSIVCSHAYILTTRMPCTISLVRRTRWSVSLSRFIWQTKYVLSTIACIGIETTIARMPARNDGPISVASHTKQTMICTGARKRLLNIGAI